MSPVDVNATAADKAAAEKTEAAKKASTEGAASVAEAVKRVADAAVAEVQKAQVVSEHQDFSFTGTVGGRFTIRGKGFSTNGAVSFGGVGAATTGWGDDFITGRVPDGIKPGLITIEVIVDPQTKQKGTFRL